MSAEMNINDEFHKDGKLADVTIVVEDHKILVCKAVLSIASPVFCAMFEGDFQEKTEKEIQLPGKSYENFVEFLRCIYPDKMKMITGMACLEEMKEKFIYLASEHTLYRLKAARTACQISDASHYKIIELALRRRELYIFDDRVFK
ncbi:kelch-like protein 3, partial [Ruditapes philippinarum]|uniref:kelch-like protein 3 n=1 Tax=Ruditapes philippinarum TaxID=129788 RepID=UPI00295BDFFD